MSEIVCYMPTYSPSVESDIQYPRSFQKLSQAQIDQRSRESNGRIKPWVYMDAIDSVLNTRPDIRLVVADGKSTDSIRTDLQKHHNENQKYDLVFYAQKMSQWAIFNDIFKNLTSPETKYFVYTSSDVIWKMDWIAEAIKEFENNPNLQIIFPTVNNGDPNLPCQIAEGPRDEDSFAPPYQAAAQAPCLNAYAMIIRMDLLRIYEGYPDLFRNCYTESFLHYLCKAVGGEMHLMPRGWCFHHGTVDIWEENGSYYHYDEEVSLFAETMNNLKMAEAIGMLTPEFLKKLLWKKKEPQWKN